MNNSAVHWVYPSNVALQANIYERHPFFNVSNIKTSIKNTDLNFYFRYSYD